jgi:hypothetical protein
LRSLALRTLFCFIFYISAGEAIQKGYFARPKDLWTLRDRPFRGATIRKEISDTENAGKSECDD